MRGCVKRTVPLVSSLAVHLLLGMSGWAIYHTFKTIKPQEHTIRIALRSPEPSGIAKPPISPASEPLPPPKPVPPKITPLQPEKPTVPAPQSKPVVSETLSAKPQAAIQTPTLPQAAVIKESAGVSEVPPKPVQTAPAPVPQPSVNVQAKYETENLSAIRSILAERLTYPRNALRLRQQGEVVVSFLLSPSGEVSGLEVTRTSDFDLLDAAAKSLIESSSALFPKPTKTVRITVPISYKIH